MEIIKRKIENNKNDLSEIELVNGEKHLKFHLTGLDFLTLSYTKDDNDKIWHQEDFEISQEDEDVYNIIDSYLFSFGDEMYLDSLGAYTEVKKEDNKYKFVFLQECNIISSEITAKLVDDTLENRTINNIFLKMQALESKEVKQENVKILSKTLNNILKK